MVRKVQIVEVMSVAFIKRIADRSAEKYVIHHCLLVSIEGVPRPFCYAGGRNVEEVAIMDSPNEEITLSVCWSIQVSIYVSNDNHRDSRELMTDTRSFTYLVNSSMG